MDGKRRRVKARVRTHAEARAKLDELRNSHAVGRGTSKMPTLAEYLDAWIARRTTLADKSVRGYKTGIGNLNDTIGHVRLDRLTQAHVDGAMTAIRKKSMVKREQARGSSGERTAQVAYDTLRAALNWAVKRDRILDSSPLAAVERPKSERAIDYLTRREAKAFLTAVADDRYRAMFHVAVALGLRFGEIAALHWRDVDLDNHALMVTRTLNESREFGKPKTKTSKRRIDLPASIRAELLGHKQRNRNLLKMSDLVFATERGTALHASNFERRHFFPGLERAGLRRIRFHDLRHTCAAIRLLAGEHPAVIQGLLGHSSIRTTLDTYGHIMPTLGKEAAARYDETMAN